MQSTVPKLVVQGVREFDEVPGLDRIRERAEIRFAPDIERLASALPGADVVLGWQFSADDLSRCWSHADSLRWIQWGGAGVDAALFPELVQSEVQLTNMRGVFDLAMAEYVLGLVLFVSKGFARTLVAQREQRWDYRLESTLAGQQAVVVGVGSIGRAIAQVLRANGLRVSGVGRRARSGDPDFETVHGAAQLHTAIAQADHVVLITPLTEQTRGMFDADAFKAMKRGAHFVNVGRGALVDEAAMTEALDSGQLGFASLDVFALEPLPKQSTFWSRDNVFVSPHMSGDTVGCKIAMAEVFLDNFERYVAGQPLCNLVDKKQGFVVG